MARVLLLGMLCAFPGYRIGWAHCRGYVMRGRVGSVRWWVLLVAVLSVVLGDCGVELRASGGFGSVSAAAAVTSVGRSGLDRSGTRVVGVAEVVAGGRRAHAATSGVVSGGRRRVSVRRPSGLVARSLRVGVVAGSRRRTDGVRGGPRWPVLVRVGGRMFVRSGRGSVVRLRRFVGRPRAVVSRRRVGRGAERVLLAAFARERRVIGAVESTHSAASATQPMALILGSSVIGQANLPGQVSLEQYEAQADGFAVTVVSDAQWASMDVQQFAQYQVLIIGDHVGGSEDALSGEAAWSAATWEPVVMASSGNKLISGLTPVNEYGYPQYNQQAPNLIKAGIAFAGAVAGGTGVYFDVGLAGNPIFGAPPPNSNPAKWAPLDGLTSYAGEEFWGTNPGAENYPNVVGSGTGFTDTEFSNESPGTGFSSYPQDWSAVALAPSVAGSGTPALGCGWDAQVDVCGTAVVLASGSGVSANLGPVASNATVWEEGGAASAAENQTTCQTSRPVNCATGAFWHTFTDASVPGPGVAPAFTRTYSSADASVQGPLGYGWTDSCAMSLAFSGSDATVMEADGAQVPFYSNGAGGFAAPPRVLATLTANSNGTYTYTRDRDHVQYVFNASGQLISEIDRDDYVTSLGYTGGLLTSVSDPEARSLTISYQGAQISQLSDPAGDTWTYSYDSSGNLHTVVANIVTSSGPAYQTTWTYGYAAGHLLTTMTDPDNGTTTNWYNASGQVYKQQDPAGDVTQWSYSGNPASVQGSTTTITDPSGHVTVESYQNMQLQAITKGYGSPQAATTAYQYDPAQDATVVVDPDGYGTNNTFDAYGDLLTTLNGVGDEWHYTYNNFGEPLTVANPDGVTTTYTYNTANGDLQTKTTPLTAGGTAVWQYSYADPALPGLPTAIEDPDQNTTQYGYDKYGNLSSVTDAAGNQTTFVCNVLGERTSMVAPRGNVKGANPASFTTTYGYTQAPFEVTSVATPSGTTLEQYNGDGAITQVTDADAHATGYQLNGDNQLTQINLPGTGSPTTKTSYWPDGTIETQTDSAGKTTSYTEDALGRIATMTNPAGQTTSYSYDGGREPVDRHGRCRDHHKLRVRRRRRADVDRLQRRDHVHRLGHAQRELPVQRRWVPDLDDRRDRLDDLQRL